MLAEESVDTFNDVMSTGGVMMTSDVELFATSLSAVSSASDALSGESLVELAISGCFSDQI